MPLSSTIGRHSPGFGKPNGAKQIYFGGKPLLRRKTRPASAALGGVGVNEVEALAHEGFFEVEHHAGEVEEALGGDEEADRTAAGGIVGGLDAFAEDEGTVALAG